MKYNFLVKPEVYKIFVEEANNEEIEKLKQKFSSFRITYDTEPDLDNPFSLIEILNAESDHQQILLWGVKEDNSKTTLAYWLVGDGSMKDEEESYKKAIEVFELIQKEYKID